MTTSPPSIETYHCHCTTLLLASTTPLTSLPLRKHASSHPTQILPLPPSTSSTNANPQHYAHLLPTLFASSKPTIIRLTDGFEKRWMLRCSRCKLGIGYFLDWAQYDLSLSSVSIDESGSAGMMNGAGEEEEGEEKKMRLGRRGDVVYLLEGGLTATGEMGIKEG